jgi:trans-2,3-dihydro-3-hydroxyanthranilate isomerase
MTQDPSSLGASPRCYPYVTVDVFTTERFGGNPVAVFLAADGLSDREMQSLAAEMNYSETTFVLPPADPANHAQIRIFNRTAEMPFAGHPNVGTAFALAAAHPELPDTLRFEEQAGLVSVRLLRGASGAVEGAQIDAPQPLQKLGQMPAGMIAACVGLAEEDVLVSAHQPTRASVGIDFVIAEVRADVLARAVPDLSGFRAAARANPWPSGRLSILLYAHDEARVRARMFAPLAGTWEDAATGSANAALAALLLDLKGGESLAFETVQGVEMGRPSLLRLHARKGADGVRASVGGECVPVFRGAVDL